MKIINHLLKNPEDTDFDVTSMLHKRMQDKADEISKSINGNLTKPQAFAFQELEYILNHYWFSAQML